MKKYFLIILTALFTIALCGCSKQIDGQNTPVTDTSVVNPYVTVDSPADFSSELSLYLPIPADACNVICCIGDDQFAQIDCIIGDYEYCFRAQDNIEGKELCGMSGEWERLDVNYHALYYTCDSTSVAVFKLGVCAYSVTSDADISTFINVVEEYMVSNNFVEM